VNKIGGDIESIGPVSDRDFNRGTDEYPCEATKVTRVKNLMIEKKREEKPASMHRTNASNDEYSNGRKEAIVARKYVSKKNAQTSDRSYQESDNEGTKKVGVYLEKMRERNSSLQERLNLSFKNSSRLDSSAITSRPSTTLKHNNQLNILDRGQREYQSLPRQLLAGSNTGLNRHHSKTPNILNFVSLKNQKAGEASTLEDEEEIRFKQWGGMKP